MQPWVLVRSKAFRTHQLCSRPESSSQGTRKLGLGSLCLNFYPGPQLSTLVHVFLSNQVHLTRGSQHQCQSFWNTPPRAHGLFSCFVISIRGGVFHLKFEWKPTSESREDVSIFVVLIDWSHSQCSPKCTFDGIQRNLWARLSNEMGYNNTESFLSEFEMTIRILITHKWHNISKCQFGKTTIA